MKHLVAVVSFLCLATGAPLESLPEPPFYAPIAGRVATVIPGRTVQIFVESDYSKAWQQFPLMAKANDTGHFQIQISHPGYYWLIAIESTGTVSRRGACLIELQPNGEALWHPLPKLLVSNKWGGVATAICTQHQIPLLTKPERMINRYRAQK